MNEIYMSTKKLILFRIYNVTLGKSVFFSELLKKLLVKALITKNEEIYCASSKYFDIREIEDESNTIKSTL